MPDISQFIPVVQETIETIRARLDANINMGLDPADPRWTDTTEGGIYWDLSQIFALECDRLWDTIGTEIPAAMFPSYAWGDFLDEHALTYGLVRKVAIAATGTVRFTGTSGTLIPTGTQVGTVVTDPDGVSIVYATTQAGTIPIGGFIDLSAQALETGTDANVGIAVVALMLTPIDGIASVSNTTPMSSGENQESDTALQDRILVEIASTQGAGTVADYIRWALSYPGVGNASVQAAWAGGGTVRVVITDENNQPVSAGIVSGLQTELDPSTAPGQGQGLAPIGAIVTVQTPNLYYAVFETQIVHATGYTLDGTGGTIATRTSIDSAINDYVNSLPAGGSVLINRCEQAAMNVPGVYDCIGSELAGYLTSGAASSGSPVDRNFNTSNLPVPAGSVADLWRIDLS